MTFDKDPWSFLRHFTHARIALGRAGHAVPTNELLDFRMSHSKARDSVWSEVDFTSLKQNLESLKQCVVEIESLCQSKQDFLLNPDLGRKLSESSRSKLGEHKTTSYDCILIIGDGLSASAIHENAWEFSQKFLEFTGVSGLSVGPIILAKYARVGLGDPIGEVLGAKSSIMVIGERPGLASADSLSVYFTYNPCRGKTDADRNCISNIHAAGISPTGAAVMTEFLLKTSLQRRLSGVDLKLEYPALESSKSYP